MVVLGLWVLLALVSAEDTSSIYTQPNNLQPNLTQSEWQWEEKEFEFRPQVGDIIYEEIATVPLKSNASCTQEIDRVVEHIPSIDSNLSYETTYSNGSKTYTLWQVRTITPCSKEMTQQEKRTANRFYRRKPKVKRFTTLKRRRSRSPNANLPFLKNQPFQVPPAPQSSPQYSTAIVSCGPYCPWQCNGILVGPQHVLTSAQCIHREPTRNIKAGFLGRGGSVEWYSVNRFYTPRRWLQLTTIKYDYALIRLTSPPGREALSLAPAPISTGNDVTFWALDSRTEMRKSTCASLSAPYGLQLTRCSGNGGNAGAAILKRNEDDYVVIGVLSGREGQTASHRRQDKYLGTSLTRKKIIQINSWINKF